MSEDQRRQDDRNCPFHSPSATPLFFGILIFESTDGRIPLFRRNPVGVVSVLNPFPRVARLATLGWRTYPRWGWIKWVAVFNPSARNIFVSKLHEYRNRVLSQSPGSRGTSYRRMLRCFSESISCPKAQGSEERATLGQRPKHPTNPSGVLQTSISVSSLLIL